MKKTRSQKLLRGAIIYSLVLLLIVETLAPVAWMFVSSISEGRELLSVPPHWLPHEPTFERYNAILFGGEIRLWGQTSGSPAGAILKGLFNSFVTAASTTVICLVIGVLTAYAIARLRFRGNNTLKLLLMAVQMLPPIVTVIPLFIIIRALQLVDSSLALILTYSGFTVTYVVWVMSGYISNLPIELEEAAFLDGCSRLQALLYVTLPLALPGLVAVGTFSFLGAWNEFLFALIFTHSLASKTLPVVISEFSSKFGLDYGMTMTGGFIASLPPVLLALAFQKYLVRGLTAGAVRG